MSIANTLLLNKNFFVITAINQFAVSSQAQIEIYLFNNFVLHMTYLDDVHRKTTNLFLFGQSTSLVTQKKPPTTNIHGCRRPKTDEYVQSQGS